MRLPENKYSARRRSRTRRIIASILTISALTSVLLVPASAQASPEIQPAGALPEFGDDHIILDEPSDNVAPEATSAGGYALLSYAAFTQLRRTVRFYPDTPVNVRAEVKAAVDEINLLSDADLRFGTDTTVTYQGGEIIVRVVPVTKCGAEAIGCTASTSLTATDGRRYINTALVEIAEDIVGGPYESLVIRHELGHAMGLAHFDEKWNDEYQVMKSFASPFYKLFRSGDRRGLAALTGRVPLTDVIGKVDTITESLGNISAQGWTYDRDNPSSSVEVTMTVNGKNVATSSATPLTDPADPSTNFRLTVPAEIGQYDVCISATVNQRDVRFLKCQWVDVSGAPSGYLETVEATPGYVRLQGWARDPDTENALTIRVTVDGKPVTVGSANTQITPSADNSTDALTKSFSFYVGRVYGGTHTVCAFVDGVGRGATSAEAGCKVVTQPGSNPLGVLDSAIQHGPRKIRMSGWTVDLDTVDPVAVHVYVNGRFNNAFMANTARTDIARILPAYGQNHGFTTDLSVNSGRNEVCAYAINIGTGTTNTQLGCRIVQVTSGNPFGNFESASRISSTYVRVSGWALDPDTVNPVAIHVYVSGRWGGAFTANTTRADVGRIFQGYGNNHGMSFNVAARSGQSVCVYAINAGTGSTNPLLGCRTV